MTRCLVRWSSFIALVAGVGWWLSLLSFGADKPISAQNLDDPQPVTNAFFLEEVWAKVGALECLKCHKLGGDAEDSNFVLVDPKRVSGDESVQAIKQNRDAFTKMGRLKDGDQSRLLLKATGGLDHGGQQVLKPDSAGHRVLQEFVRRVYAPIPQAVIEATHSPHAPSFFDGIVMLDDRRLLRRVTLSLAGRLPTDVELAAVSKDGLQALPSLLDQILNEDAFYTRLREGFNDIFLTLGVDGNADQTCLSYEHFEKTRHWYQKHDLSFIKEIADKNQRQRAEWKLAGEYRDNLLAEPMKLIEHIVRNDRPFTELVTADYIMLAPYAARGYGVWDEVKDRYKNPNDTDEYIPVRLKALVGRNKSENQDSETGFYPHAGMLSTFQYLTRYPTTETNRNRLRARMYYQHFLGVDVLELAARVSDAAAVTAKYEIPTMQASECVVCHKTLDPVAGLFQDYWRFADQGVYGKRKGGWFADMFGAGFEGEALPSEDRWRALQWLGERTAKDPRFASTMVEHVYYILTGRKVLLQPKDIDDPLFGARQRAFREQRKLIESIATRFAATGFNLKQVFKELIVSDFYRADGLSSSIVQPQRRAELEDIGLARLLSPEQVERKLEAVFTRRWGRLTEQTAALYGAIDFKEVTERPADPSGAMGAIQRILANDVACKQTALDFSRASEKRILFPNIEPDVLPGSSAEADAKIRAVLVHLHYRVLGRVETSDSLEITRSYQLFAGVVADAAEKKGFEPAEVWSCRQGLEQPVPDSKYTVRAWRAVLTYLLRHNEFLYE